MSSRYFFLMQAASSEIFEALIKQPDAGYFLPGETPWTGGIGRKWLFPEPNDIGAGLQPIAEEILEEEWIDQGLNDEQRVSIDSS